MRILALDISTKTGWSIIVKSDLCNYPTIEKYGRIITEKSVGEFGEYPFNYLKPADHIAKRIYDLVDEHIPDCVVIEETNKSRARYSQKILEFIHCKLLDKLCNTNFISKTFYINTSDWRRELGIYMTKEDKKNNTQVNKAKRQGKSKKELGLKGKITRKHIAIRVVKEKFGIDFKQKENDIAEAICIGIAFCNNPPVCNGKY